MAWYPLAPASASFLGQLRADLAHLLADGHSLPAMFSDVDRLRRWAGRLGLRAKPVSGIKPTLALDVSGSVAGEPYYQTWASVRFSSYARALRAAALHYCEVDRVSLAGIHADHVINRARLKNHKDAWVMLFPVPREANSPFGAIERRLANVPEQVTRIDLTPLVALKLFCGRLPRTETELALAMNDVRGQLSFAKGLCDQMQADASRYMRPNETRSKLAMIKPDCPAGV